MPSPPRIAWDTSCFIAWLEQKDTEDPDIVIALIETMRRMRFGQVRIVASTLIELEFRAATVADTHQIHEQLRAAPSFEAYTVTPQIRSLALELADRLQESGRRGRATDLQHVATAISARAVEFWTTDRKVIAWHTEGIITEVKICRPYLAQGKLFLLVDES